MLMTMDKALKITGCEAQVCRAAGFRTFRWPSLSRLLSFFLLPRSLTLLLLGSSYDSYLSVPPK